MKLTDIQREACARAAHEVNRAYCFALGDLSQAAWELSLEWQKESALKGVDNVAAGNSSPEGSHQSWLAEKEATGWKYGPVKDPEKKEHPCMVPYAELPLAQRFKDELFVSTVSLLMLTFRELALGEHYDPATGYDTRLTTTTWEEECKEWQAISDEMIAEGKTPTAYDVSKEQRRRMQERGQRPLTYEQVVASVHGK